MQATFDAQFLEFSLGSFSALCKLSDSTIFKTLPLQQFSLNPIKLYENIAYYGGMLWGLLPFLAIGQVLQKLWHFEILTLESMGKPKMW